MLFILVDSFLIPCNLWRSCGRRASRVSFTAEPLQVIQTLYLRCLHCP